MTKKLYVTKVEILDGQLSIVFPPGFLDLLKLQDGQFLFWDVTDETITIHKKVTNQNAE